MPRDAVAALLDALDLGARRLDFVAKASTSEVWKAETAAGLLAVRILAPHPGKPADLDADVALRQILASGGARVAAPLLDSGRRPDLSVAAHRPAWAVDRWIDGGRADTATADPVWYDLGVLLADLHGLPARGHGRLRVAGDRLEGRLAEPDAGVADRFDQPWPFDGSRLAGHPLAEAAPDLVPRLQQLEDAIRRAADAVPAIIHGDLNGANIRHADGRLRGLLDLADAAVLVPTWDFALLRHFHGAGAVGRTLAGYTADREGATALAGAARLLAPVVALHHLSRARTLGLPARRAYAVDRLRHDLAEIEAGREQPA
ncbi:hypothetical protein [Thalassobaculum sp.]|uniref:phosphotransferase n=1 Tax=Thalassobaculum sp. TaxID=2022740 RepID=UPI0032EA93A5